MNGCCFPVGRVNYNKKPKCESLNMAGLQVQLNNAGGIVLPNRASVVFNNMVTNLSPQIAYNTITGEFTVLEEGVYVIDWWLNILSADLTSGVWFYIKTSTGVTVGASSYEPFSTSQLKGQALVYLPSGATFSLINNSNGNITYATSQIQADLRVFKLR